MLGSKTRIERISTFFQLSSVQIKPVLKMDGVVIVSVVE